VKAPLSILSRIPASDVTELLPRQSRSNLTAGAHAHWTRQEQQHQRQPLAWTRELKPQMHLTTFLSHLDSLTTCNNYQVPTKTAR
jgi:hypothetical protein